MGTDYPGSPNIQADLARLPLYTTYGGYAGFGQRFNRFEGLGFYERRVGRKLCQFADELSRLVLDDSFALAKCAILCNTRDRKD